MFCKKCGKEIDNDAVFCPECGEKVSQKQADDTAAEKVNGQEKTDSSAGNTKKKKKSLKVIVGGAIFLLALVAAGAWCLYPYSFDKTELNNGGYYVSKRYKKASRINYGNNDVREGFLEIERSYYDAAGKACADEFGWHRYIWEYDSNGKISKVYCYGKGKDYEQCLVYDSRGLTRYDCNGNMKGNSSGIARIYNTGEQISLFGADDKPIACKEGWSRRLRENNRVSYYGVDGKYTVRSTDDVFSGWAVCELKDDGIYLYDADMKPVNCKAGWHSLTKTKEDKGIISIIFCDKKGNWVRGDSSDSREQKDGWNWSIYVNHDYDGYTVWYDQKGMSLAVDESANEVKKKKNEEENEASGGRALPRTSRKPRTGVPYGFSQIDDEYYKDYVIIMFSDLSLPNSVYHLPKDIYEPSATYPYPKWKDESKKEGK